MEKKKRASGVPTRRKRGKERLSKPVWVYFDPDEHERIDQAATIERRSKSSFVADAALDKADNILRVYNQGIASTRRRN